MRTWSTGIAVSLLLTLCTLLLAAPLVLLGLIRLLPVPALRDACAQGAMWTAEVWVEIGRRLFASLTPTVWDVRGEYRLRRDVSYLIVCNHQSWVDIPALLQAFNRQTPFFKFFVKQELAWIPLLGLAFWALDYPFMKRYSKARLARQPHLRERDLDSTRRACAKFRRHPVTVVNYVEGTRFTPAKHARQQSPYRYLLKPKAGGVALVLNTLDDRLEALLDVTVLYPGPRAPGFWALLSGQVPRVTVEIRARPLDPALCRGDYQHDAAFRQRVQDWLSTLWQEKDARIARYRETGD